MKKKPVTHLVYVRRTSERLCTGAQHIHAQSSLLLCIFLLNNNRLQRLLCAAMFWFKPDGGLNAAAVHFLVRERWSAVHACPWVWMLPHLVCTAHTGHRNRAQDHLFKQTWAWIVNRASTAHLYSHSLDELDFRVNRARI